MGQNGRVFKRVTWFGIGAAAGATGVVWAQQKIRRRIDAMGPDHIVVTAGNQARKVSQQVGRTVAGAVVEGRAAMREREDELLSRRDVYTYDVLSWALLKADRLEEALEASCEALRLGTRDPRLLYHAGMVARALGERVRAAELLCDALALNPSFDVLQAPIARRLLEGETAAPPCQASPSSGASRR